MKNKILKILVTIAGMVDLISISAIEVNPFIFVPAMIISTLYIALFMTANGRTLKGDD